MTDALTGAFLTGALAATLADALTAFLAATFTGAFEGTGLAFALDLGAVFVTVLEGVLTAVLTTAFTGGFTGAFTAALAEGLASAFEGPLAGVFELVFREDLGATLTAFAATVLAPFSAFLATTFTFAVPLDGEAFLGDGRADVFALDFFILSPQRNGLLSKTSRPPILIIRTKLPEQNTQSSHYSRALESSASARIVLILSTVLGLGGKYLWANRYQ